MKISMLLVVAALLTALLQLNPVLSAAPVKDYTQLDYYRELLEFNRRELVQAYQTGGKRNPKWDAAATSALDMLAMYSTQDSADRVAVLQMYPDDRITDAQLGASAQAAIDLGCDDPMVLYAKSLSLINQGLTREARPWLGKAEKALAGTKYSPMRRCRIINRGRMLAETARARADAWSTVESLCVEIARQKYTSAASRREAGLQIYQVVGSEDQKEFEPAIKKFSASAGFDPWILDEVATELEIMLAFNARGDAWAAQTSDQQMRQMQDHLAKAKAAAEKAAAQTREPVRPGRPQI